MKYTIVNADMRTWFNITQDGEIYARRGLDREKKVQYVFTVMLEERRPTTKIVSFLLNETKFYYRFLFLF